MGNSRVGKDVKRKYTAKKKKELECEKKKRGLTFARTEK
jgi:hypothetical protein